jgi:phosphoglycerol transferase MdoB-like AlkP superfamily enzyme
MKKMRRIAGLIASIALVATTLVLCVHYHRTVAALAINFGFLLVPACLCYAATGQWQRGLTLGAALMMTIYALDRMKVHYYKEGVVASDVYTITDFTNWDTLLHYPVAGLGFVAMVGVIGWATISHRKTSRHGAVARIVAVVIAGGWLVFFYLLWHNPRPHKAWIRCLPRGAGPYANLFFSSRDVSFSPPKFNVDDKFFLSRAAGMEPLPASNPAQRPDIVVWLQESTVNPEIFDLSGAQAPKLSMFGSNSFLRATSWLRVHTFGGRTWMSEFALLSGLVSRDFGESATSVFYTVVPHLKYSLFKVLETNGYETIVLSPFNEGAYHAGAAFQDMGLNRFVQPQDLGYPAPSFKDLWGIESQEMADYAKKILDQPSDKPRFLYLLSMKEHGPYNSDYPDKLGLAGAIGDQKLAGSLNNYIDRIIALNAATEDFSNYLMNRKYPTMFLYFGDHQPKLRSNLVRYRLKASEPSYFTQFVLRDNLPGPPPPVEKITDLSFIGGLLLERAGLKPDAFFDANIRMRRLTAGQLQDYPDTNLVNSYKHYLYQTLRVAG